ncbi:MAG: 50S ribosomal protein L11 methyltransferase [Porticoccaceae bacterium]|nr:50S ribosomal protein L11 methyltransferase [Porticoccaceae bacterium]
MSWLQLHLDTSSEASAPLEQALLDSGAVSVTLSDSADVPILEPGVGETPLWQKLTLTALFPADIDTDLVLLQLSADSGQSLPPWRWEILEDQAWERLWMDHYHPIRCGQRLWICPSWCQPPEPDAINLMLDPGLAFGTGSHATTFLCLQWLDSLDLEGKTLIDYGCGSGILAIAATLLGARKVIAIDNDPQALLATADNAQRNGIDKDKLCICGPDEQTPEASDYLVANILAAPLIQLAEHIMKSVKAGGQLCLSGIVDGQVTEVREAYVGHFAFMPPVNQDDWVRLVASKQ